MVIVETGGVASWWPDRLEFSSCTLRYVFLRVMDVFTEAHPPLFRSPFVSALVT